MRHESNSPHSGTLNVSQTVSSVLVVRSCTIPFEYGVEFKTSLSYFVFQCSRSSWFCVKPPNFINSFKTMPDIDEGVKSTSKQHVSFGSTVTIQTLQHIICNPCDFEVQLVFACNPFEMFSTKCFFLPKLFTSRLYVL